MNGLSPLVDQSQLRSWIVCESGSRWLTASQRFVNEMLPDDLIANIVSHHAVEIRPWLIKQSKVQPQAVVLWEVVAADLAEMFDRISQISLNHPSVLQIVVASGLADRQITALTQLGVGAVIVDIEQLPKLRPLVRRHFTRSR